MDEARQRIEIAIKNNVTTLDLSYSGLTSLPPELFLLSNLQALILYGNQLTSLPSEVSNWTALQRLYLGNNRLTSLPPAIQNWTALQRLSLNNNQLTSLPPTVQNWTALRIIYIDSSIRLPIEVVYWRSIVYIIEWNQETNEWIDHINVCDIGRFLRSRVFSCRFPQYYEKLRDYWTK